VTGSAGKMRMSIIDLFTSSEEVAETHSWLLSKYDPTTLEPEDILAREVAIRIMEYHCRGCPHLYAAWKERFDGGAELSETTRKALAEAFIEPVFGLPDNPDKVPSDHLEGYISQMLWYFLYLESPPEELIRIEPPGFKSTDPGGDALAVHRISAEYLMFRLWEIKKYAGESSSSSSVSSTVGDAYEQLDARALEYLARYTTIGQEISEAELSDFYGQLVDLWINATREAAIGVSVTTSLCHIPDRCFTTFGQRFPRFIDPIRLRGMLNAVGDFSEFALKVREFVWKGL
jgi:hypothetical protein